MTTTLEAEPDGRTWEQVLADAGGPVPITTDVDELLQLFRLGCLRATDDGIELGWDALPREPLSPMPDHVAEAEEAVRHGHFWNGELTVVCEWLAGEGVTRRAMPAILDVDEEHVTRWFGPAWMDDAVDMVRCGATAKAVADRYGIGNTTVSKWCHRWGVEPPGRYGGRPEPAAVAWLTEAIQAGMRPTPAWEAMQTEFGHAKRLPSRQYAYKIAQRMSYTTEQSASRVLA